MTLYTRVVDNQNSLFHFVNLLKETIKIMNYFHERVHEAIHFISFSAVYIIAFNFAGVKASKSLFELGLDV